MDVNVYGIVVIQCSTVVVQDSPAQGSGQTLITIYISCLLYIYTCIYTNAYIILYSSGRAVVGRGRLG